MTLDLRLPIGLLFFIIGSMLVLFGLWSDKAIYARSLDINVNVLWGLVMVVFGSVMSWFGRRAMSRTQAATEEPHVASGTHEHGHGHGHGH